MTTTLRDFPGEFRHEIAESLQAAGRVAEEHSRANVSFGGHVAKAATRAQLVSPTHLRISNDNPVAHYLEDGTRPHVIVPRAATRLVFRVEGRLVTTRKVNHPGTRAHKFVSEAAEAAAEHFVKDMTQ